MKFSASFLSAAPFKRDMKFEFVMINMALVCSAVLGNSRDRINCTPAMHFV